MLDFIRQAIAEDIGDGDHTSLASIPAKVTGSAQMIIKENGIIAGIDVALKVFHEVDSSLEIKVFLHDGQQVKKGDIVLTANGYVHSILKAERLVLNIMQRMSGIATTTKRYVDVLQGFPTKILDTRKTTPNFRDFEKMAVKSGGGYNHRFGLFDMILIKDNHIDYAGGVVEAINSVKDYLGKRGIKLPVEIEARTIEDVEKIITTGGVDRIMLDNFSPGLLKEAVDLIGGRYETEASGGITFQNIRKYAETGVDYISVGALTHSYKSLDISLKAVIEKN
jgi:nicotinate-nucleotide pyrophosphorylase (carboxylating)